MSIDLYEDNNALPLSLSDNYHLAVYRHKIEHWLSRCFVLVVESSFSFQRRFHLRGTDDNCCRLFVLLLLLLLLSLSLPLSLSLSLALSLIEVG